MEIEPVAAAAAPTAHGAGDPAPPASAEPAASVQREEFDEEDEDVCRICRNPGDAENPLRYPCACSGSIKYVHQDCLLQWLNHSNNRQCEVCKHAFSFSPVYADNAPARLPVQEFVVGMGMKACHVLQFFVRLGFVLSVWILIIPFITFWIWRLSFVRSFSEAQRLFMSHITTALILTDCLHGFLLSASIVFIFLGATSLRDYFRHLRELGGHDGDRDEEVNRNGGRAARRVPAQANRIAAGEGNGEDAGGAQGIAGAGQIIRRNAENVAARWEMQAARLEAHVEQMFDGLDDNDGAEDVPFDELVGMQGPVFHLVENAFTVLASNMIFLGVVVFVPFTVGRIILHYISWIFSSAASPLLSTIIPLKDTALSLVNITLKNALGASTNVTSEAKESGLVNHVAEIVRANATALNEASANVTSPLPSELLEADSFGIPRLSDLTTVAIGYIFIFSLVFLYLGIVALVRYSRGEPLAMGRLYGLVSVAETIPSLVRQFVAAMKHLMTMVKVAFLLVIELGVFPILCGWWLDICTVRMFGKSMTHRVHFLSVSLLASSIIHWVVGIVYMLQISVFVGLLRAVLRTGVLYFLRDPADPNYNPFRDLIDDPVHKHARRVLLSLCVYGSLIVMLIFLPVKLAMRIAPSVFPLDITVSDPFTEIPADMLLFQICIPFAVRHFKLRTAVKSLLHYWFTVVGWALGLTDFLLPRPDENGPQENRNPEPRRRHRFPQQEQAFALRADADDQNEDQPETEYGFVLRIILLLLVAWMTLLVFNSLLIVVPVSLGRALFNAIPILPMTHGIKCNDIYAFVIGSYVIWTAVAGVRYSVEQIMRKRVRVLFSQIWKWSGIVLKSSILLLIWVLVIPVLVGLLFELLVIVPMRVPVNQSPVFLLYQDWALGLIFLKIWTRLVMLDHMMPLVDDSWRLKFERVKEDGFSRLRLFWVLREIVSPIMMNLLTALCVPYVLARGIFPILGYPLVMNSLVYRFAWLGCLLVGMVCFSAKRFHVWFTNLHNSIRDDRYLIGRRLHNFGEDGERVQSEAPEEMLGIAHNRERVGDVGLRLRHAIRQDG
uniref:RING-type E3 ubiquitin transferase n=1 Tax=Kalanchoe fedtschenkoi TaxID=63787 RepID=A0A7N0ZWS0_KALFE